MSDDETIQRGLRCLKRLRQELLDERVEAGYWSGELSASALSTATAVSALSVVASEAVSPEADLVALVKRGCGYLDSQQNEDGGYGDTDRSHSNIATSYLVLAARTLAARVLGEDVAGAGGSGMSRLRNYIESAGAIEGLRRRYGKDKTFVVPILTNLAIAGLVPWRSVPRLPFEAAVFPAGFYRFLQMPVVSYAIPALVAIGQAHHFLGPRPLLPIHRLRAAAVPRTTAVLRRMQPASGGYLEATPLTSFVLMSLAASARARRASRRRSAANRDSVDEAVAADCVSFLRKSIRADGSWPIDTNLATWITSLSIHALARWSGDDRSWVTKELIDWHLNCQHSVQHPFTGAKPGGWGWTDLSGAVPDGDDTPAAILAIQLYREAVTAAEQRKRLDQAVRAGLQWLVGLQNSDGGMPTFCRGWGRLPFDRSSTDLTAHFLRAIDRTERTERARAGQAAKESSTAGHNRPGQGGAGQSGANNVPATAPLRASRLRAVEFLRREQRPDGSWLPLWFGNQDQQDDENPVYGTARAVLAIAGIEGLQSEAARAVDWLLASQNRDGGWGGGASLTAWRGGDETSSVEETSVALEAIADYLRNLGSRSLVEQAGRAAGCKQAIIVAVECLVRAVDADRHRLAWPIGFYFAKLWYYEKLYPLVFATAALSAAIDVLNSPPFKVETSN